MHEDKRRPVMFLEPRGHLPEAVRELSPEQFRVTQRGSTECPGTGEYLHNEKPGIKLPDPRMVFHVTTSAKNVEDTGAYRTAVNVPVTKFQHPEKPAIAGLMPAIALRG